MAGRMGPLRGVWGLSPLFPSFSSLAFFLTQKHTYTQKPISQTPFSPLSSSLSLSHTSHTYSHLQLFCFSLWAPPLSLPHPTYMFWNLWRRQPCPTRDAKNGDMTSGQRTWATPPCIPTPAPPDGLLTSYAAHLKPIESLGGRECLTQISTSEGVSATLGNY